MCCINEGCDGDGLLDSSGQQDITFRKDHLTNLSNSHAKIIWPCYNRYICACSAGLINNEDQRPLFLTARHCVSQSNAGLETFFKNKNNVCDSTCDQWKTGLGAADTVGMTVLASKSSSDFTLFETNSLPNNGKNYSFLGWNSDSVAAGTRMYRVR